MVRYKPEASYTANLTNWRPGIDAPTYTSTYTLSTAHSHTAKTKDLFPRINKNASDQRMFGRGDTSTSMSGYTTENRDNFHQTYSAANSRTYVKRHPAPGFDRATANKTNYSLDTPGYTSTWKSTTHAISNPHPSTQPAVEQGNIGGWMTGPINAKTGKNSYFTDSETSVNIKRGGGGGGGVFGVDFDIINNAPHPLPQTSSDRESGNDRIKGKRISNDRRGNYSRFASGFERVERDIITGKEKVQHFAPRALTKEDLKRDNVPSLSTRPW